MATTNVLIPALGESVTEATIIKWHKKEGDAVKEDEPIADIATDKVDSEIPAPASGFILKIVQAEGTTVEVGGLIAIIGGDKNDFEAHVKPLIENDIKVDHEEPPTASPEASSSANNVSSQHKTMYSPLVRSIAKNEDVSPVELAAIKGSGISGRLTKNDLMAFIEKRAQEGQKSPHVTSTKTLQQSMSASGNDTLVEMDRMRQLIAEHMVNSIKVSAHVTSFAEADMTMVVKFRDAYKDEFQEKYKEKLTYTHIIMHVVAKALRDFPMINASVNGKQIIIKRGIHIGMATALPNGNLIVPVLKNADEKNLPGIMKSVNDLALRARNNKLIPDEIQGGTFTITNLGSFNSLTGTPIINQPQAAILAAGVIKKRAVVIETESGDVIAIRPIMYLSLTYDHRIIDGALGGMFLDKVVKYMEGYPNTF